MFKDDPEAFMLFDDIETERSSYPRKVGAARRAARVGGMTKPNPSNEEVVVSLIGLDETFAQTVHARHVYTARDIV